MATVTFTATTADGTAHTRTTQSMPYVAAVAVNGGPTKGWGIYSWHKTHAAAAKAAASLGNYSATAKRYDAITVVPVTPTAITGSLGDWTPDVDGWGAIPASEFEALVAAKRAGKVANVTPKTAKASGGNSVDGARSNGRAARQRKAKTATVVLASAKAAADAQRAAHKAPAWTDKELAYVQANTDKALAEIATALGRTVNSVRHKVRAALAA